MLFDKYMEGHGASGRHRRDVLVDERTVRAIEGLIGEPLDLNVPEWGRLLARLPQFSHHEWEALRIHGRGVIDAFTKAQAETPGKVGLDDRTRKHRGPPAPPNPFDDNLSP